MKIKTEKLSILVAVSVLMISPVSRAVDTIAWGTTVANLALANNGITPLPGSSTIGNGGFVQLLFLGANGLYDGYVGSGTGVAGDDVVEQTTWVGSVSMGANGQFGASAGFSTAIGSKFEIRFFDTISPNYAGGAVPTTGNYGLSQVFTQAGDPNLGGSDTFSFNQNYSTTTAVAVPEPSTVALMLAGLGVLGITRMRRK